MSALRGIGAAFEGFTRGLKLADEMETNLQNREIRLAAEKREAQKFSDDQELKAKRDFYTSLLSEGDGVGDFDKMGDLEARLAAGPKKAAKGVTKPAEKTAAQEQPAAAPIPAPAVDQPPPASGIPSPAQTFAYGTNPAPALGLTVEGAGAPAPQAPAAVAPQAPVPQDGQPAEPAPRMIPAYGTNKELRDRVFKFNGEIYKRLALLDGKYDLAMKIPEMVEEVKAKEYDRNIGRSAVQARMGDVGALRKLLEVHGSELGYDGYKVPVGAAQAKDGSWEVVGPNGPEKITLSRLDALAIGSANPSVALNFFIGRKDKEIEQGQKDIELGIRGKEADARIKQADANAAEVRERRRAREDAESERLRNETLQATKRSAADMLGFKPVPPDKLKTPQERIAYEQKERENGFAQAIIDSAAEPGKKIDRRIAPAAVDLARVLASPENIALATVGSMAFPDRWQPKSEPEKQAKARYDAAVNARALLTKEVKRDERGHYIIREGVRIPMPPPEEAPSSQQEAAPKARGGAEAPAERTGILGIRAAQQAADLEARRRREAEDEAERGRLRAAGIALPGDITNYAAP